MGKEKKEIRPLFLSVSAQRSSQCMAYSTSKWSRRSWQIHGCKGKRCFFPEILTRTMARSLQKLNILATEVLNKRQFCAAYWPESHLVQTPPTEQQRLLQGCYAAVAPLFRIVWPDLQPATRPAGQTGQACPAGLPALTRRDVAARPAYCVALFPAAPLR